MKVKERGFQAVVSCRMCCKKTTLLVSREDLDIYSSPNRPHVQDIFPYLSPAERELLISGICPDCWDSMFPIEDEDEEDCDNE